MRFGTVDGRIVLVKDQRLLDVADASAGQLPSDVIAALERWDDLLAWSSTAGLSERLIRLLWWLSRDQSPDTRRRVAVVEEFPARRWSSDPTTTGLRTAAPT